jgi:tetratricopeptide (TPR) repeat protein
MEAKGQQELEEALRWYTRGLATVSESNINARKSLHEMRGARMSELERYAQADGEYAEALRLMPESATTWRSRAKNAWQWAQSQARTGEREEARRLLNIALNYVDEAMRQNTNDPLNAKLRESITHSLLQLG